MEVEKEPEIIVVVEGVIPPKKQGVAEIDVKIHLHDIFSFLFFLTLCKRINRILFILLDGEQIVRR